MKRVCQRSDAESRGFSPGEKVDRDTAGWIRINERVDRVD